MKKVIRSIIMISIGFASSILFGPNCLTKEQFLVKGNLFGQWIDATVDDYLAKLMLTNPHYPEVKELFRKFESKALNTNTLAEISRKYSMDVATLYYVQKLNQVDRNRKSQDLYFKYFEMQLNATQIGLTELKKNLIVFVPGLAYKEDATTGADFSTQRKLLNSFGISHELVETGEWSLTEENALIIAERLRQLNKQQRSIILVSASKGSLETAIALGSILKPEETTTIKSWISVGGILRGSPIADRYLTAPYSWMAEFVLWIKGKRIDIVKDLSYKKRKLSFEELKFSDHIKIIHLVAAPLSTNVDKAVRGRFKFMQKLGPNDGMTPLADEVTSNGIVIFEIGLDHYFRDRNIEMKTLALALVAIENNNL